MAKTVYPPVEVLWQMLERLGSRQAIADELVVKKSALRAMLQRKGLDSAFYAREREIELAQPDKVCSKCGRTFPRTLDFFYAHPATGDGLMYRCKTCSKQQSASVRETRPNPGTKQRYAQVMKISREDARDLADYSEIIRTDPCVYCGRRSEVKDHIVPLARGGEHSAENMAPSCGPCNSSKRATPLLQFLLAKVS